MTIPVALAGVSGILSVSGISRKRCGMAKPLTLGEVARRSRDGEGKDADKKQKNTAIQALFVRDIVSLRFRVLFCRACPLRRWRASSPKGRALGKKVTFSMKPICVCWKTSRNAKASHFERLPRPGEVARKCQKGARCLRSRRRGQGCCQRARHTAIRTLLVRAIVSLCFRVLFCRACPLRRWRASSPKGRALGKEVKPSCTPPCRGQQADSTPSG